MDGENLKRATAKVGVMILSPNGIRWEIIKRYSPDFILIKSSETDKVVYLFGGQYRDWKITCET